MSDTLTNIQTDARFWASDRELVITTGDNLRIANQIYQGMLSVDFKFLGVDIGRRWPEVTREDTSITFTAGTKRFNMAQPAAGRSVRSGGRTGRNAPGSSWFPAKEEPSCRTSRDALS